MRKSINLEERHRHSGKGCELYFAPRFKPWSILPTTFTKRDLYRDLLYFCNIRWLSRGEMLRRVYILREKLAIFFEENINATGFRNQKWVPNLAFLVDLTSSHLNNLNLQLRGKLQFIHEMWSCVRAFETKLWLWEIQLGNAKYAHFATLQENKPMNSTLFVPVSMIRHLRTKFSSRFSDICFRENDIRLFSTPFDIQVDAVPEKYHVKLIELQCSNEIESKFQCEFVLLFDFDKKFLESKRYPNLVKHAKKCHPSLAALVCVIYYFQQCN